MTQGRFRAAWLVAMTVLAAAPHAVFAQACRQPPGPLALVLSGGGAKGFAHVGVLEALDRRGIRPDLIVGTSMGSVVGAMYASGLPARVIDSLVRAVPLTLLFQRYEPEGPRVWEGLLPLVFWEQGERGFAIQTAAVREAESSALLNAALLRGNLLARGRFDDLPIPFRAVATDLADRSVVVLDQGDLAQAVRASSAIPLVFAPERVDGRVLVDGGLSANIPVEMARQAGARRVIVSDATEHPDAIVEADSPVELIDRLLNFLFRQPPDSLGAGDVMIQPLVTGFRALDFSADAVSQLIDHGRQAADSALDAAGCAAPAEALPPRAVAPLPDLRVAGLDVADGHSRESLLLRGILGLSAGMTIDERLLRDRFLVLGEADPFRSVWLGPTGAGDTVRFTPIIRHAPRRIAAIGLTYDNELGGRMWIGLLDRFGPGRRVEASGVLTLGELRKDLQLGLRRHYGLGNERTTPVVLGLLGSEDVRAFDASGTELPPLDTKEARFLGGVEQRFGRYWSLRAGVEMWWWRWPDHTSDHSGPGGVVMIRREGPLGSPAVLGEVFWSGDTRRAEIAFQPRTWIGRLRLEPNLRVGWGRLLPLQATFPLGGPDGFPGLHLGERRGDREVLAALQSIFQIKGPIGARLLLAVGRSATGGEILGGDGWLGGARVGLGADTPVGPVLAEYGIATNGRGAAFVRVGRWF